MAGDGEAAAPGIVAIEGGRGGVGAHVRSALLLGHAHAHGQGAFLIERDEALVVVGGRQTRSPGRVQRRVDAQRGRHRVAHRHGTQHAGLGLGEEHEARRTLQMGQWPARPRRAMQAVVQRTLHQRVVAGMEFDLVDAVAEAVVRVQQRRVRVGQARVGLHRRAAGFLAQRLQPHGVQRRGMRTQRVAQRLIGVEEIHAHKRARLVKDLVRGRVHCLS